MQQYAINPRPTESLGYSNMYTSAENKMTEPEVDWREDIAQFVKYQASREFHNCMTSSLQSMWIRNLERINVTKYHIKVLSPETTPVHSALYRARPKTRDF